MPKVEETYSHDMTKEEAVGASKRAINKLLSSFEATSTKLFTVSGITGNSNYETVEFSCKSRGFPISGKVVIKDNEVDVTVSHPSSHHDFTPLPLLMAIAFKGLVKASMDKHIPKHLKKE